MQLEYMAPSALCLAIKVGIICKSEIKILDKGIIVFLIGAITLNAIELAFFSIDTFDSIHLVWLVRLYYVAIFLCLGGAMLSAEMLGKNRQGIIQGVWAFLYYGGVMALNPVVISGYIDIGYSISAEKGPLYWAVIIPLLGGVLTLTYFLSAAIKTQGMTGSKAKTLALGLSPMMFVGVAVLIGLQFGSRVNAVLMMSVASLFYVAVVVRNESASNIHTKPIASQENIDYVAVAVENGGKKALDDLKRRSAKTALKTCEGDKNKAAQLLGISKVSWYRWLKAGTEEGSEARSNQINAELTTEETAIQLDIDQPKLTLVKPRTDG